MFQNESCEIVIKQRILQKKRGIHCSQIFTFFVVAESGWTGVFYRLGMLPRPRTPSPSACCGNGCNPCVMDLHQQVGTKCGIFCVKTWDRQKIYRTGSGDVAKRMWGVRGEVHKCSKTSTFELHRVWGGHKSYTHSWIASRWWRWKRHLKAVGSSSCAWAPLKCWATRYRIGWGGCCHQKLTQP